MKAATDRKSHHLTGSSPTPVHGMSIKPRLDLHEFVEPGEEPGSGGPALALKSSGDFDLATMAQAGLSRARPA